MSKRVLILSHLDDSGAMQVAEVIGSQLGFRAVELLQPETLALTRWSHNIDCEGRATTSLKLTNHGEFNSESIGCLFDRLGYFPSIPFAHSGEKNRNYAAAELQALVTSWKLELGTKVVNPLSIGSGIVSPISQRRWLSLAQQCGLPISRSVASTAGSLIDRILPGESLHQLADWPGGASQIPAEIIRDDIGGSVKESVLVCGNRVFGSLSEVFGLPCLKLARSIGYNLLEIQFGSFEGQFRVVEVSPSPLLTSSWAVNATAQMIVDLARR